VTLLVLRRIGQLAFVVVAVTALVFGLLHLSGDPAALIAGESATLSDIEELRERMGFNRPWYVQYGLYMSRLVQGDMGMSIRHRRPVATLVVERLPATLQLTVLAQLVAVVIAFPIGVISAIRRNTILDRAAMGGAVLAQSVPIFWLGMMLILLFSVTLRWTPVGGRGSLASIVLPVVTLSMIYVAQNARLIRSSLLEVMSLDFVRTARSKGVAERSVILRHALRNALIPVVTILGLQFGHLISGAIVTEIVFAWPGIGRLMVQAVLGRDVPLVLGATMLIATFVVLVNLVIDLLYGVIDPRAQTEA
jgi:ABC-type dipeptide/oligopeptide/nickel transport system permease component